MRLLSSLLFLLVFAQGSAAETVFSPDIAILDAGVVCAAQPIGERDAPGTISGRTHVIVTPPPFVSYTRQVPAVIGVGFGISAQAADPAGLSPVTVVLTHPPMGAGNIRMQTFESRVSGTGPSIAFFQFDHSYELVEGEWSFTAMLDQEIIYKVSFTVVSPLALPELANACGYGELLS